MLPVFHATMVSQMRELRSGLSTIIAFQPFQIFQVGERFSSFYSARIGTTVTPRRNGETLAFVVKPKV